MKNNIPWDLIISKLRENLAPEEEIIFNEWLLVDNNQQLFQQIEIVWKSVQEKSATYNPDLKYHWQKLSSRIRQNPAEKRTSQKVMLKYFSRIAMAASILLIVSFFFTRYLHHSKQQELITYSTQTNRSTILLPDSSEIILHSNTVLNYTLNKKLGQREVNITGEAYFKVKHDDKIPFVVNTHDISIKVHGTEFNVCSYASANKVLISLVEGSISMNTSDKKHIFLKPGEEALYNKNGKTISVKQGDVNLAKIWTGDKIRFENKSLHEVCKYLSKWYGVDIKIDPDIVENQSYTFTVTGQPLTEIIEIMSSINSFDHYFTHENELVLKQKK